MENRLREKTYFSPGDLVSIKHDIEHKPVMIVKSVDKVTMKSTTTGALLGVTCFWFSTTMELQQARFNTKDLTKEI